MVRHLVQLAERLEHGQTDLVSLDLGAPLRPDALLDALGEDREVVLGDRAALAGLADADEDLLAAERLGDAGPLDDAQAGGLDRGEAATASGHWRRRRMAVPSSVVRESMTRESLWRQKGQCIGLDSLLGTVRGTSCEQSVEKSSSPGD